MMKNVFAASTGLAAFLSLISGVWAKPSDLPVDNQMQCPVCQESSPPTDNAAKPATDTTIDTVAPTMVAICLEKWLQDLSACRPENLEGIVKSIPYARWLYSDRAVARTHTVQARSAADMLEAQAKELFSMAEGCRLKGEYARARAIYQQVHLLTPTSRQGQMAIDRLVEIEERMRQSEESEVPQRQPSPGQSFRQLRDSTIPLGLVEVMY